MYVPVSSVALMRFTSESVHTHTGYTFSVPHMSRIGVQFMKVVLYRSGYLFAEPFTQSPSHSLTS